ncbi:MAG: ferritin family protein [Panacagrimonas sp.]
MKMSIPTGYPGASFDAVNLLYQRSRPSLDDLRVMSMIEAAGESFYHDLAAKVSNEEAKQLLLRNAREERLHAERLAKAFGLLGGGELPLPVDADNPYAASLQAPERESVNSDFFAFLTTAENDGHDGYERWAQSEPDPEIAALYRLNAREEKLHGKRDERVRELLS